MPFPIENFELPPREHKKVNYAEFETFSDSSSENNKKQNHGNYISWTSSEDAILTEQVKKYMESQKTLNLISNEENGDKNSDANNNIVNLDNNEKNLNLNKEKILPENKNDSKEDVKDEEISNINTVSNANEPKINPLTNINWSKIAEKLENKNARQCQTRWQNILDPNRVKGPWTKEEDMKLIELVNKFGPEKWSNISSYLPGRLGKQCRERWYNHLNPEVRKTGWSKEEEWVLFLLHRKYGNSWSTFSEKIPGRTDNTIKNHWNSIMKKNIVGINNQYQEMIKGKTKEEIEGIEKNIMDKCYKSINKDYNEYYQEKLKNFPMMKINKHSKKDKDKDKENENNLNNNDTINNDKNNSVDDLINNIDIKTPTKSKKKIFENIKIIEKEKKITSKTKSKNKKINDKKEEIIDKKKTLSNENKENKRKNSSKRNSKYFNINDEKELKIIKSGEKILQKDKSLLIKEAENKYKEKQKLKRREKKSKSFSNLIEVEEENINKKVEKMYVYSNKKTAKKAKRKINKSKNINNKKKKKAKFNVSKLSNKKEKDSPNINNLNNIKFNLNNNFINNSTNNKNFNNNYNNDFMGSNNINFPFPTYPMEKFPYYDEEKDYTKINFNKILISESKDINKAKREQQFSFKIPPNAPLYRSEIKNSSESSGGNNSLGKITPDFRMNPTFIPSNDKFAVFTNPHNLPPNRGMFFNNSNPKMIRFVGMGENNNNNNKISTDSNSIHSYSINQSILSAHSAFKKSSSGSGSGSGSGGSVRGFQQRVGAFSFNNMADLNKEYFSNITIDEKNFNNKM